MGAHTQSFYEGQLHLLEQVSTGAPLPRVLDGIVRLIEQQSGGMLCSILLLDRVAGVVRHGAAPSLPPDYSRAIDGLEIGPEVGSCGRAAFLGERVIVEDVATHPYWAKYRHLALPHGLCACWSSPIFSRDSEVLGTFAIYYRKPRGPSAEEIQWVDAATHLAAIAISHERAQQALEDSEQRSRQLARLYAVSSSVNEAIARVKDVDQLFEYACRIPVEQGLARFAWIGIYDEAADLVQVAARFGGGQGDIHLISSDQRIERARLGPLARVLTSGRSEICDDLESDPRFCSSEVALSRGLRSCAVFPITQRGSAVGVFALYGAEPRTFQSEEARVLDALAADISFAVDSARAEAERQRLVGELGQRVKELTLLHQTAHLLESQRPFAALLAELVHLLPKAWQHPELCEAQITWQAMRFVTPGFLETRWRVAEPFGDANERGSLEVAYRELHPSVADTPFLAEEVELIQSLARMLSAHLAKRRSEAALRSSEQRLSAMVEHTPNVSIQWFDLDGRILYCNKASERLFAAPADQVQGKRLEELNFAPEEAARFRDALQQVVVSGQPAGPLEFQFRHADGSPGVVLSTLFELPDPDGDRCFVCMDVDLTEHRRMEQTARRDERLLEIVYRSVVDVLFCVAVEAPKTFRVLSVNPAFLGAVQREESQVIGKLIQDVLPATSPPLALGKYEEAASSGRAVSWEEAWHQPSGVRHGELSIAPVLDSDGRCTHLVGTVRDITPRKRAEEERRRQEQQLHHAQRLQALGTLAGGIAHDFNNVLMAITGNVELGLADAEPDDPVCELLLEVQKAASRAGDLVRQILSFSRRDAPVRKVIDVRDVIGEVARLLRATLPASVTVELRLADDVPQVSADGSQLHQVIMNLGMNAALALRSSRGVVCISAERAFVTEQDERPHDLGSGCYALVRVSDTGCGMDEATLARIFEPFFTTRPHGQGTGLGLSVVHGIVQQHEGAIGVQSAVGQGTTFSVYFPAAAAPSLEPVPARNGRALGNGKHILYVDDEDALVFIASRGLSRSGYRVTTHSDSVKALSDFRSRSDEFDAVVTDFSMPGLSGPELVREMRRLRPDVPIIMLSGYMGPEDIECVRALDVGEIIWKPHTVEDLVRLLERRLGVSSPATC